MRPALLIVDMLQDFFQTGKLAAERGMLCAKTNELVAAFRANQFPVIWVRQEFDPSLADAFLQMRKTGHKITIKGTNGCLLLPELQKEEQDFEIIKKRYSAFFETGLDSLLKKLNIDLLVIAGVNTHACIRAAAVDAYQRDFEVVIPTDCVSSYDENYNKESLRYLEQSIGTLKTNKEILESLS